MKWLNWLLWPLRWLWQNLTSKSWWDQMEDEVMEQFERENPAPRRATAEVDNAALFESYEGEIQDRLAAPHLNAALPPPPPIPKPPDWNVPDRFDERQN